jgi:hypothetical protein
MMTPMNRPASRLMRFLPVLTWLPQYRPASLRGDVTGAATAIDHYAGKSHAVGS